MISYEALNAKVDQGQRRSASNVDAATCGCRESLQPAIFSPVCREGTCRDNWAEASNDTVLVLSFFVDSEEYIFCKKPIVFR